VNLNDQKNSAKTLENDSLRVQSGTTASLHNGLRFPIVTTTFSSLLNNAVVSRLAQSQLFQTPAPSVEYVDLGTTLKVTPVIVGDHDVKLQFSLQVRNIAGTGVNGIPVIGNREYTGVINLRQGESAIIAGTIEDSDAINNSGIPGLSSIPGLAALGGNVNHNRQRNQVLITVTPRSIIIPDRKTVTFPTID
jgi:general secretion pathway protein D